MIEEGSNNPELKLDCYSTSEKNRGRTEIRNVQVFKVSKEIQAKYSHSKSFIQVHRIRINKGIESDETVYYISDLEISAKDFYDGIRGHWSIENKLHYVKDVVMNEDKANMRNKLLAPIISIIRSFVISIARIFSDSVLNFQRTFAHNLAIIHLF